MYNICCVNGALVDHNDAYVSIFDRGYYYGDGVFEVMLYFNKKYIDIDSHFRRFERSIDSLFFENKPNFDELKGLIADVIKANNAEYCSIYIQMTRGVEIRGHSIGKGMTPQVVIFLKELPYKKFSVLCDKMLSVSLEEDIRWARRDIKTLNLLGVVLIKRKTDQLGLDDAILYDKNTNIIAEATSSNVFIVDNDGNFLTHPKTNDILHGTVRQRVILLLKEKLGITVKEQQFTIDDLKNAKEVFLTSSIKLIQPVITIDGNPVADGCVGNHTKQVISLYEEYVRK